MKQLKIITLISDTKGKDFPLIILESDTMDYNEAKLRYNKLLKILPIGSTVKIQNVRSKHIILQWTIGDKV